MKADISSVRPSSERNDGGRRADLRNVSFQTFYSGQLTLSTRLLILLRLNPRPSMLNYLMSGGGGKLATVHITSARCTKTFELSFSAFFNYSILQYTVPILSKPSSFCVTLVNILGSHSLILSGLLLLNCGILTLLYCTLSTFF